MKSFHKFQFEEIEAFQYNFGLPVGGNFGFQLFYIDGLLIDTGAFRQRKEILRTLKALPVQQIFLTHHHEDHSGNLKQLKEVFDCSIYATTACCRLMKSPPPISYAQKMAWGERPPYFELIEENHKIETDKFSFQLIHTPGHAEDMAVLFEPNKRWLLSADLFVNKYINYFLDSESMKLQISSIKKVLALDWDYLFCSHHPKIKCERSQLEFKLQYLENFYQDVADLYHKGFSAQQIFKKLDFKENWTIRILSIGMLSKLNMVKAVIRDVS